MYLLTQGRPPKTIDALANVIYASMCPQGEKLAYDIFYIQIVRISLVTTHLFDYSGDKQTHLANDSL